MTESTLSRRSLLAGGAGLAAAATLSACAPGAESPATPPAGAGAGEPPRYIPFDGPAPDLAGTADGVPPMFVNYPNPPAPRAGFPLTGIEPFTALAQGAPPATPPDSNRCFAAMATTVGTSFDVVLGYPNYLDKFQVTMAGGDIPDLCQIVPVAHLPRLLETHFTDLTDVLGGDGIAAYPALANIPTPAWQIATLNGRLWGIAQPRPPAGTVLNARGDLLASRGLGTDVTLRDGSDFTALFRDLTDRKADAFALGADPVAWLLPAMLSMLGGPNEWTDENGTFTHENTSEQMKSAIDECGKLVRAGYLHPNSFSDPGQNGPWFTGGVTAMLFQSFVGWGVLARGNPDWQLKNVELPQWNGGGAAPIRRSQAGYSAFVAIKKGDDARLEQLLRVCDYIASPFGTEQQLEFSYGVEGYTYTMENGNPVAIPDGPGKITGIGYAGSNVLAVLYGQGDRATADAQHDFLTRALPTGVSNAVNGLYSETATTKAATLTKQQADVQREIMLGRKPLSEWDEFTSHWQSEIGEAMAAEYAEAAGQ